MPCGSKKKGGKKKGGKQGERHDETMRERYEKNGEGNSNES